VAQERVTGTRNQDAPTYVRGQRDKQRNPLLDYQPWKGGFKDVSCRDRVTRVVRIGPSPCQVVKLS
jgi:hypothetical protein